MPIAIVLFASLLLSSFLLVNHFFAAGTNSFTQAVDCYDFSKNETVTTQDKTCGGDGNTTQEGFMLEVVTTESDKTVSIPVAGVNQSGTYDNPTVPYSWTINWGDSNTEQTGDQVSAVGKSITHEYTSAGTYQIKITPTSTAATGWFDAFGAVIQASNAKITRILTPLPKLARTVRPYMFYGTFFGMRAMQNLPENLFWGVEIPQTMTNFESMFKYTFPYYGANTTVADISIPEDLFKTIDTQKGENFNGMFYNTFALYSGYTTIATDISIPKDLFKSIDTSSGTDFSNMFNATFTAYALQNTDATNIAIPAELFQSINTSKGINFTYMFAGTFLQYADLNTQAENIAIPEKLFEKIDTSSGTNFTAMFAATFSDYAESNTQAENIAIPADLFKSIDTSSGDNFFHMFYATFSDYAKSNTGATDIAIPENLFQSINTGDVEDFTGMFYGTFTHYAHSNTAASNIAIPEKLFAKIDTSSGTNFFHMFDSTFMSYAYSNNKGKNIAIPEKLFEEIDTSSGTNFNNMFGSTFWSYAELNTIAENIAIPENLFQSINTSSGKNFAEMFYATFANYALSNTTATNIAIPENLFQSINTSNGTSFSQMFLATFGGYAYLNTSAENIAIPADLFKSINTSSGEDFDNMFNATFWYYGYLNTSAENIAIPADLFKSINTSKGKSFVEMFYATFADYAESNTQATEISIPERLFAKIDTSSGTNFTSMFSSTFASYAYSAPDSVKAGAKVPETLFESIVVSEGTLFDNMFANTFTNYATKRKVAFNLNGGEIAGNPANPQQILDSTFGVTSSTGSDITNESINIKPVYDNADGLSVSNPGTPTKTGGVEFAGWYRDQALKVPFDITSGKVYTNDVPTEINDITLYAAWKELPIPTPTPTPASKDAPTPTNVKLISTSKASELKVTWSISSITNISNYKVTLTNTTSNNAVTLTIDADKKEALFTNIEVGSYKATVQAIAKAGGKSSVEVSSNQVSRKLPVSTKYKFTDLKGINQDRINDINWLSSVKVTVGDGCNAKGTGSACKFMPKNAVNRGAMAEFLYKLAGETEITNTVPNISDISKLITPRQDAIKWLALEKITILDKGNYNPQNTVNRGAMAEFMYKLAGHPGSVKYGDAKSDHVDPKTVAAQEKILKNDKKLQALKKSNPNRYYDILWLAKMNVTVPIDGKYYYPQNVVNRGAMAQFMHKLYYVMMTGQAVPASGDVPNV